jgi:hypothetical protein
VARALGTAIAAALGGSPALPAATETGHHASLSAKAAAVG